MVEKPDPPPFGQGEPGLDDERQPPPPTRAQALLAEAGVTVYEPGEGLFDQPALIYLARRTKHGPAFDVFDHVGRPLAREAELADYRFGVVRRPYLALFGDDGQSLFAIRSRWNPWRMYTVSGIESAVVGPQGTEGEIPLTAGREPVGAIVGLSDYGAFLSSARELRLEDHNGAKAACLQGFPRRYNVGSHAIDWVMTVNPKLRGPLRRLAVVAPSIARIYLEMDRFA